MALVGHLAWPSSRFLPAFWLGPLTGALCGAVAVSLIVRVRVYCDAGNEPGHRFGLLYVEIPSVLLGCTSAAGILWRLVRPRSWKAAVCTVVPISLRVSLLLGWAAFASPGRVSRRLRALPGEQHPALVALVDSRLTRPQPARPRWRRPG